MTPASFAPDGAAPDGVEFVIADPVRDRDALITLNTEYLGWVFEGISAMSGTPVDAIVGMPLADYVPTIIAKVCADQPPRGVFYIVRVNGELAGMGGLRHVQDRIGEIKRVYIRPLVRGARLGERVLARLVTDARTFGYKQLVLDTAPFMTAAHRLYERHGFEDCAAYPGVEVPSEFHANWRFMQRAL